VERCAKTTHKLPRKLSFSDAPIVKKNTCYTEKTQMTSYRKKYEPLSGYYICSYDGCLERHYALGLCRKHWNRANLKKFQEEQGNRLWMGFSEKEIDAYLEFALSELSERERQVIHSRFIMGKTLREAGIELSVTRQRVMQIESVALRKIRSTVFRRS
jgi:RNA polymerase sigma factor (sigma-70 family)